MQAGSEEIYRAGAGVGSLTLTPARGGDLKVREQKTKRAVQQEEGRLLDRGKNIKRYRAGGKENSWKPASQGLFHPRKNADPVGKWRRMEFGEGLTLKGESS